MNLLRTKSLKSLMIATSVESTEIREAENAALKTNTNIPKENKTIWINMGFPSLLLSSAFIPWFAKII